MKQRPLNFGNTIPKIRRAIWRFQAPAVTLVAQKSRDPFRVLISCLISLRTKDEVTDLASNRLFAQADTPAKMLKLHESKIAELIFPAGFYRTKAKRILEVSHALMNNHAGRVPDSLEELLTLKGVGRKTANLVLTVAYGKPGICVDTHVHRISNRLGWVKTKTPVQTEMALREVCRSAIGFPSTIGSSPLARTYASPSARGARNARCGKIAQNRS
jgi:endonuclease-3